MNLTLPAQSCYLDSYSSSVKQLEFQLQESLKLRVLNIPSPPSSQHGDVTKVAILFSGGLDCTVVARMTNDLLPAGDHIDLLNVAFENPRVVQAAKARPNDKGVTVHSGGTDAQDIKSAYESCPDRITGRKALEELRRVCPGRVWRFVEVSCIQFLSDGLTLSIV
jgi:asparagine synthetase B (glutamine-hydrolysing)